VSAEGIHVAQRLMGHANIATTSSFRRGRGLVTVSRETGNKPVRAGISRHAAVLPGHRRKGPCSRTRRTDTGSGGPGLGA
jgi:hypothetical protein